MDGTKPSRLEEIKLEPQPYSSVDLRSYTSNLSNKIGLYGEVYKGYLPDGVPVAVKVLNNNDVTEDTFLAEVCILGSAFHPNLVKFYGYCFENNMKALVFEYMENGSLDKILYENHHPSIEWVKLYGIAIEIANGLKYLHEDMDEQIIHYDIKASNVLLDKNFSAKITDFGLAKSMNRDVSRVTLTRTRGTVGYNALETWMPNSQVTSKCDVYSFGMMLFEILGKRSNGLEKDWFPGIVWNKFKSGKLQQLIKDCGIKEKDKEKAIRLSKVALWCVQFKPELRPSMEDVVLMLQGKKLIEDPPYPSFLGWQDSTSQIDSLRERLDSLELGNPMYPQNINADQTNAPIAGFRFNEVGVIRATSEIGCCHFSSDGKLIASGGHDNKAVLWYTDSLKPKTMLEEHSMLITDIRFSPSLPRFATSSFDKTVRVWDVDNPDYSLRTFTGHSTSVMSLDFHPNKEDLICSCDSDNEIRYWSINNGSCISIFKGGATQMRFQPRLGRYLATVDENVVSIIDVETQICRHSLQGHTKAIHSVCWNPSGELLASVSEDSVRIWTFGSGNEGECVHWLSHDDYKFHSCVFHPAYPSLLLIGCYQHVIAWNMAQKKATTMGVVHDGLIASLAVSNVTGWVASASHDKFVKLWKWF